MRTRHLGCGILLALLLSACVGPVPQPTPSRPRQPVNTTRSTPPRPAAAAPVAKNSASGTRPQVKLYAPGVQDGPPSPDEVPANLASIPDAVPRREPLSASGNPAEYEAFGEVYHVLDSAEGFRERGHASWYGKKFQGRATSSGEPYDMYAMTGAHKTLPIPSYVRVTNLANGKSVVVRINDRGPFHSERIVDLSYTAALKLDLIGHGTSEVELEGLVPDDQMPMLASSAAPASDTPLQQMSAVPSGAGAASGKSLWLQIAAFTDRINALNMREQLQRQGIAAVSIREARDGGLHRVVVGPFSSESESQRVAGLLHGAGYAAFRLRD